MKDLNELLEEWAVHSPGMWNNENTDKLGDWYAVSNDEGIVAYFGKIEDAYMFRLDKINQILNG